MATVGALFVTQSDIADPTTGLVHNCSASVVNSTGGDLVLTAAHCITGIDVSSSSTTVWFAPDYRDGVAPEGIWRVTQVYVNKAWADAADPQSDVAILRVASNDGRTVQQVVGANVLGTTPADGAVATVSGYVTGSNDKPITCTSTISYTKGYPTFDCGGYEGGTSGSPWIVDGSVVGVIGGLNQGGCEADVSYSSAFGSDVSSLLARAEAGGTGDVARPNLAAAC